MSPSNSRRRWKGDPASIVEVLQNNPKLPGSKSYDRFQRYCTGMTVREYVDACATAPRAKDAWIDLTWDTNRGFIRIHPPDTGIGVT
jgi:hypothetical protein